MARARTVIALLAALVALCVAAAPAVAQELEISEFETTSSSTLAGAHPDLETKFSLAGAGDPEIAKNISFELPEGIYGNPSVLSLCSSVDFALQQCPPGAQVGTIVLHANYEGDPNYLLGFAPIYNVEPGADEAARFAFTAPTLNIPIVMPVNVLSARDYRLQFTFSGATQQAPLTGVDATFWGFPASPEHQGSRFGRGSIDKPQNCPGVPFPFCENHTEFPAAGVPEKPFTGNSSVCGVEMPTTLTGRDLPVSGGRDRTEIALRTDHRLRAPDLQTACPGQIDDDRGRLSLGHRPDCQGGAGPVVRRRAVSGAQGHPQPAGRPDDQPRCGRWAVRLHRR